MRRSTLAVSIVSLIAIPISALALAANPAALSKQMTFKGNPHSVEAEFHLHHEDTHVSLWIKGAGEGKNPATAKGWEEITFDVAADGEYLRAKGAVRLAGGKIYLKLLSIDGSMPGDNLAEIRSWTEKPWVVIAIPETAVEQKTFAAGFAAGMRNSGIDVSEEDVHAMMDAVADALFTMETTRFQGGAAYSLKLAPDYLRRALQAFESSVIGQQVGFDGDDVDLSEDLPINLHIRVNTNTTGELTFVKWYAATDLEGTSLVMQGNSKWQGHPVYVEIPKNTIPVEELMGDLDDMMDGSSWEEMLEQGMPMMEDEQMFEEDEEPMEEDVWEEESEESTTPVPLQVQRIRMVEPPRSDRDCTATPGTSLYLQQARKGSCALPPRTGYRVNTDVLHRNARPSSYYWR